LSFVLRVLILFWCALALFGAGARAEDAEPLCTSIVERECTGLPRVTAKGDLRVEVLARKRSLSFPLTGDETEEEFKASCVGGKCDCHEDVEHFDFKGPVPGFRQVNAAEAAAAAKVRCSIENSNVWRQARHFAVSPRLISTGFFELEYCHGCNGSCHGNMALTTYDAKTGRVLKLRDGLRADAVLALQQHMIGAATATATSELEKEGISRQLDSEFSSAKFLDRGIYVEKGAAYVDIDSFVVLGCAGGSFFPVAVPRVMLAPDFAVLLAP
jgi:hypothetical protein